MALAQSPGWCNEAMRMAATTTIHMTRGRNRMRAVFVLDSWRSPLMALEVTGVMTGIYPPRMTPRMRSRHIRVFPLPWGLSGIADCYVCDHATIYVTTGSVDLCLRDTMASTSSFPPVQRGQCRPCLNSEENPVSKFQALGDVKALGHADDPPLILVNRDVRLNLPKPPLSVEDDNQRIFELQFLLLCDGAHTVACFNLSKNVWILYDDDPVFASTSFRLFKFEQELDSYVICLAGYVNITQAEEHKPGIPETGTGAQPFSSG
ncbi:hypothetical protein AOLI_G00038600 [Acnodon oligacanthus]